MTNRVYVGAFIRLCLGIAAAVIFQQAGMHMREIESISGDSIAEAFYREVGLFCYGMAMFSLMLAVPANLWLPLGDATTTTARMAEPESDSMAASEARLEQ